MIELAVFDPAAALEPTASNSLNPFEAAPDRPNERRLAAVDALAAFLSHQSPETIVLGYGSFFRTDNWGDIDLLCLLPDVSTARKGRFDYAGAPFDIAYCGAGAIRTEAEAQMSNGENFFSGVLAHHVRLHGSEQAVAELKRWAVHQMIGGPRRHSHRHISELTVRISGRLHDLDRMGSAAARGAVLLEVHAAIVRLACLNRNLWITGATNADHWHEMLRAFVGEAQRLLAAGLTGSDAGYLALVRNELDGAGAF